jgi:hypothetical protein
MRETDERYGMQRLQIDDRADGRAQLRAIIAGIGHEMSLLSGHVMRDDPHARSEWLIASWVKLVELLALGPAPETRACPVCRGVGMREATRCGYCWTKLAPWVAVPARTG